MSMETFIISILFTVLSITISLFFKKKLCKVEEKLIKKNEKGEKSDKNTVQECVVLDGKGLMGLVEIQEKWKENSTNLDRRTSDVNTAKASSLEERKAALAQVCSFESTYYFRFFKTIKMIVLGYRRMEKSCTR